MAATVHAFPVERRPVPHSTRGQIYRARMKGAAVDFLAAQDGARKERSRARDQQRAEDLGIVRSPVQLLLLATFRSLSYAQRDEIKKAVEATKERFPDDPSAEGALWLMRGLS